MSDEKRMEEIESHVGVSVGRLYVMEEVLRVLLIAAPEAPKMIEDALTRARRRRGDSTSSTLNPKSFLLGMDLQINYFSSLGMEIIASRALAAGGRDTPAT